MTDHDKNHLEKYNPIILTPNSKTTLEFSNQDSIHGFGWTHNLGSAKKGIWTEGNISNLFFKLNESAANNLKIKININSIITRKNVPISFTININDNFSKKFKLKNINELKEKSIIINLNKKLVKEEIIYIKFIIDNPVTKLELLKSPDARKLGILIESLELINN